MPQCAVWLCIPLSTLVLSLLRCLQLPCLPAGQGPPPPKTEVPNGLMRRWFQTGDTFIGGPETKKTLESRIWHVVPLTLSIGSQPQGESPGSHSIRTQFKTKKEVKAFPPCPKIPLQSSLLCRSLDCRRDFETKMVLYFGSEIHPTVRRLLHSYQLLVR